MSTELFLMLICFCTAFVNKREMPPALIYCLISLLFYCIWLVIGPSIALFAIAATLEFFTIIVLYIFTGCINSNLTIWLMRISIIMIPFHFYGFLLFYHELPLTNYHNIVNVYWAIIIGLLLSAGRWWNVNTRKYNRFLRKSDRQHNTI